VVQLASEQLHAMAASFADEVGYQVVGGSALTFAEWDAAASRVAEGLVRHGVAPGDRVAIHLEPPNFLRWIVSYAAVHRAGAAAVPLNPQLTRPEVDRMLAHCGAAAAIVEHTLLPRHDDGRAALVVSVPAGGDPDDTPVVGSRSTPWSVIAGGEGAYFQVARDGADLADVLYTSGTTGNPKAVAVRHDNLSLVPFGEPVYSGGGWLHASPPYTFAGLSFVYTPMKLGMKGLYQPRFDAGRWLEAVASERPVAVFLVPAMALLLLDHPDFGTADLSSVQMCSVGSAPLAPFVLERLQERMPTATVSNNYGMTEAGSVYCIMPPGEAVKRPGSVGKLVPPAEVRLVDSDGDAVAAGDVGSVLLSVPGRPREYYGDPEATASTWVDGWLVTGDLGRIDEDGYLYIVGRSKDVIIRGGNNIFPNDVEHVIETHPAVREAAVIGVPHPVLGEDLVAIVALSSGESITDEELRAYTLEHLAQYKVPRRWQFVGSLPRNATGKVVKDRLRDLLPDGGGVGGGVGGGGEEGAGPRSAAG
jgi:acyl-CoA synthetase (AMP-forming)/AMP-acid ligase II